MGRVAARNVRNMKTVYGEEEEANGVLYRIIEILSPEEYYTKRKFSLICRVLTIRCKN